MGSEPAITERHLIYIRNIKNDFKITCMQCHIFNKEKIPCNLHVRKKLGVFASQIGIDLILFSICIDINKKPFFLNC
jgi:hypothetical protein